MPINVRPIVNRNAVTTAPIQTSPQVICTSGSTLYIRANSNVITAKEITKLMIPHNAVKPGNAPDIYVPMPARTALTTKETNNKNAITRTIPNDRKRDRMKLAIPRPGLGATSQIVFNASCNWPNTPDAPINSVIIPTVVANTPPSVLSALVIIVSMAVAPSCPTNPWICPTICPLAASSPKKIAATEMAITNNGAREKIVK